MTDLAIRIRGLRKSYGATEAVRGIDLDVTRGEVFALLGPNGAGKTTTVEILEGHRTRDAGEVSVLGFDPARGGRAMRSKIGIVLQETGVQPYLSVAEAVEMYRGYYPAPRDVDDVLDLVGLAEQRDQRVQKLSGGQQRRLDVAIGLAGDPELVFLDEPTTGFDPSARRGAWSMIQGLRSLGKTVFLTTHYMDEANALADHVAIIAGGRIVAEGSPASLIERAEGPTLVRFGLPDGAPSLPADVGDVTRTADRVTLETRDPTRTLHALTTWAITSKVSLIDLEVVRPTLEDVYLQMTAEVTAIE